MMRLEISDFGGMAPLIDPTALADNFATLAKNVRLDRGVLAPGALKLEPSADYPDSELSGRGVKAVAKLSASDTRFAFGHVGGSTAFISPVAPTDTWGRVYFMGADGPSYVTTDQYSPGGLLVNPSGYRLGFSPPSDKPEVGIPTIEHEYEEGQPDEDGNVEQIEVAPDYVSVRYVYAYVDKYGHESSLSPPSDARDLPYDRPFAVSLLLREYNLPDRTNFSGGVKRVYRATFDGSSSAWQYLMDVPVGTNTVSDTLPIGQEGEASVSEGWLPAPSNLRGLCMIASSYAAGFFDHYVCYSELKLPHAWPTELQYPLKYAPLEVLPMLNGMLVVTAGRPYWAEGADPYSAIPRELPVNAPCVSGESLVDMGDYAMYVSFEGLVAVSPGQAEIVTRAVLDRSDMEALVDDSCKAFTFDGRYVFSTKDDRWMAYVPQKGLVEYDFGYGPSEFQAVSFSVRDNRHFFAFSGGAIRVVDFEGESSNVEWRSKHWRTPPDSFSCFRVEADTYPVRIKVRCQYLSEDWQESPEFEVSGPHIQRLPVMTGGLWQVVIKPPQAGRVYRVVLGQSGQEVR